MDIGKVTIYMPTHNRSNLVGRSIESVLKQTYQNIELIIVNDGSCDNTMDVLDSYSSDSRVIILTNDSPKGACYSRNRAINQAKGIYITGLDDDDYFLDDHIENLVKQFSPNYSFVCSSIIKEFSNKNKKNTLHSGLLSLNSCLHYNKVGNQVFTLTDRIRDVGGFDESFPAFQDYDLWIRLMNKYGDGFKSKHCTYVLNSMDIDRISSNVDRKINALNLFVTKHKHLFSNGHHKSMKLLRLKIKNEGYNFSDILMLMNRGNLYSSLSLIICKIKKLGVI